MTNDAILIGVALRNQEAAPQMPHDVGLGSLSLPAGRTLWDEWCIGIDFYVRHVTGAVRGNYC